MSSDSQMTGANVINKFKLSYVEIKRSDRLKTNHMTYNK